MQNKSRLLLSFPSESIFSEGKDTNKQGECKIKTKKIPTELNLQGFLYSIVY